MAGKKGRVRKDENEGMRDFFLAFKSLAEILRQAGEERAAAQRMAAGAKKGNSKKARHD